MHSPLHFAIITFLVLVEQWNVYVYWIKVHFFQNIRKQYQISKTDKIILRVILFPFRCVTVYQINIIQCYFTYNWFY